MAASGDLVLVTGASGFLATHVVKQLLQSGYKVRGTVRSLANKEKVDALYKLYPEANHNLELVECTLSDPNCWSTAVKDCSYIQHIANPMPGPDLTQESQFVKPAVEGVLNVLRACQEAGSVKRIVMTSSVEAISYCEIPKGSRYTEKNWSEVNHPKINFYAKSKTLAEKAAWDFVNNLEGSEVKLELVVINPSLILGPALCGNVTASMGMPLGLLNRTMPAVAHVGMGICDVRDVAKAHIQAMTSSGASGNRYIVDNGSLWLMEMAQIIKNEFQHQGYSVSTTAIPSFLMRIFGYFNKDAKMASPYLDRMPEFENTRLKMDLGIELRSPEEAILSLCYSLIENGRIRKTAKYTGPKQ